MFKIVTGKVYSHDDVKRDCLVISEQIKDSNYRPDIIVGISDGGTIPAQVVGGFLSIPVILVKVSRPSYIELFKKIENFNRLLATVIYEIMFLLSSPKIKESFELPDGKNVLLVDDMSHTGKTLKVTIEHLNKSLPKSIKTAVISNKSNLQVDYFMNSLKIIFPWSKNSPHYDSYAKYLKNTQ